MKYSKVQYSRATQIIQQVAKENGVTEANVRRDMEQLIAEGMNNPDSIIRQRWNNIPRMGKIPTPEEVIIWSANQLHHPENIN